MKISHLHHVSLAVTNLENSAAFYTDVFGMRQITRPPLKSKGIWLSGGSLELHLISNPAGSFRQSQMPLLFNGGRVICRMPKTSM